MFKCFVEWTISKLFDVNAVWWWYTFKRRFSKLPKKEHAYCIRDLSYSSTLSRGNIKSYALRLFHIKIARRFKHLRRSKIPVRSFKLIKGSIRINTEKGLEVQVKIWNIWYIRSWNWAWNPWVSLKYKGNHSSL